MIKHVVIWKLKDLDKGPALKEAIEELDGKIPGLISIEAGLDINKSDAAGDLILISTHESKEALATYQDHPLHLELKEKIIAAVTSRIVVDYII